METCSIHGCRLEARHGNSRIMEDFEVICPQCEAERRAKAAAPPEPWAGMVREAYELEGAIRRRMPPEGFLERNGPEKYNRMCNNMMRSLYRMC